MSNDLIASLTSMLAKAEAEAIAAQSRADKIRLAIDVINEGPVLPASETRRERIMRVLSDGAPARARDIAERTSDKSHFVSMELCRMATSGTVRRVGRGLYAAAKGK